MVDVFLIVATVVAIVILLIIASYLLVHYQHPDDHNDAYVPKLIVLLGFVLAGATVLMLPLDVANNEGYAGCEGYDTGLCGGLNMELMWDIVFWMIPIWVFVLIPFATFYYEADDGMLMAGTAYAPNPVRQSRIGQAICYQLFVFVIIGVIFAVTYISLSDSKIPVQEYVGPALGTVNQGFTYSAQRNATDDLLPFDSDGLQPWGDSDTTYLSNVVDNGEQTLVLQVSLSTFYAGLMAWLGWFLFAIFGGIGLAALPLDLYLMFKNRPRHMDAAEFAEAQLSLRERVNEMVDIGELIKIEREQKAQAGLTSAFATFSLNSDTRKAARDENQAVLGFKQAVYLLEQDVEDFQNATVNYKKYNVLIPYIALLLSLCAFIVSIFWFIHVIVYVFPSPPLAPFLNNYFEWFDKWFPLFGVLSVALFVSYLLLAALKGCFKFGIRFLFFHIHPMKVGKTYMSSFMFNIALVLLCALPAVQFSQAAFADYAAFAEIRQIFGVQIQFLQFFSFFWTNNVFIYCFLAFTVLTSIYLCCKPQDETVNAQALRDRLRSRKA
jgi:LMBR1 domain-containing protein 1